MSDHHRYELAVAPDEVEPVTARLWAAGTLGVWQPPGGVVAWFASPRAPVPEGGAWSLEPDRDWQAEWKASIGPVHAGRFVIVPSWLADGVEGRAMEGCHRPSSSLAQGGASPPADGVEGRAMEGCHRIVLDPGRAFGSGHHATTTLCLERLEVQLIELAGLGPTTSPLQVADVGCGSGILAIAAAKLGAHVVAVDIDVDAVAVTRENAVRNCVDLDVRVGGVEALPGPADVVVANLLTETVIAAAGALVAATRRRLVVSGIGAERRIAALTALTEAGLEVTGVGERDGWLVIDGTPAAVADAS